MAAPSGNKDGGNSAKPGVPRKVYIETSVWGMTLPDQPRALREPTMRFLRQCDSGLFRAYISEVVLDEIGRAPGPVAAKMRREIDKLAPAILLLGREGTKLAKAYLQAGVIPAKKHDDARHVAVATVAGLELVEVGTTATWRMSASGCSSTP
jgi:hypothetical protein